MRFVAHDGTEFEIPDEWLERSGVLAMARLRDHYASSGDQLAEIGSMTSPKRNPGVTWFHEDRMLPILGGFVRDEIIPPIDVDSPPGYPTRYRVRDGLHRYYASVAAGFHRIPVRVVPVFD